MGVDKAFLKLEGKTLLDRALAALRSACGSAAIVGDPAKFAGAAAVFESAAVVGDVLPGCGPLGGIHAALVNSRAELNAILAVDMPFASAELIGFLLGAAEESGAMVTLPRIRDRLQPLCAIYRREFAAIAEQALRAGTYKIDATFAGQHLRVIEEPELVAAGFSERSFLNVNSPEDHRHAADLDLR